VVVVLQDLIALCLVTANQKLEPHNLPFGVTASSPVISAVASKLSLTVTDYLNQAAALQAIDAGQIYGAYVPGSLTDTLIIAPQKSFFAAFILTAAFQDAARKLGQPLAMDNAKPLPTSDRLSGVTGLLLPLLIGGFFAAVFTQKLPGRAVARWRAAILVGCLDQTDPCLHRPLEHRPETVHLDGHRRGNPRQGPTRAEQRPATGRQQREVKTTESRNTRERSARSRSTADGPRRAGRGVGEQRDRAHPGRVHPLTTSLVRCSA
jgi:hypothetical protein